LAAIGATGKSSDQYTNEEIAKIKERAQAIREEKIKSLRTAFDDWIEAEQEIKEELKKKIDLHDLFDLWFDRSSSRIAALLKKDSAIPTSMFNDILERQYVELMAECMR
jgi:lysophospholipase L1-like esterase